MAILLRYAAEPARAARRVDGGRSAGPAIAAPGPLRVGLIGPGLFARSTLLPLLAEARRWRSPRSPAASGPRAVGVGAARRARRSRARRPTS